MEKAEIRGTVEKITYRNRDNGYTVFKVRHGKKSYPASAMFLL